MRYNSKIGPNESDFVKNIRATHCKGCMNENGYCSACSVLDCWLRHTYLPEEEWSKANMSDIECKMTSQISDEIDKQILKELKIKFKTKIYCIEEWVPDDEKCRDGYPSETWKMCKTPITHEFEEEDEFKNKILDIINNGGVISKVYIKEDEDI